MSSTADWINSSGHHVTINAGAGDDTITFEEGSTRSLIQYANGDGKDIIFKIEDKNTLTVKKGKGKKLNITSTIENNTEVWFTSEGDANASEIDAILRNDVNKKYKEAMTFETGNQILSNTGDISGNSQWLQQCGKERAKT